MPNKDENYINKADLGSVIQKVRIENESQEVRIANADDVTKPLIEEEKKKELKNLEEKIERKKQSGVLVSALKAMTKTLFNGLKGFAKGVLSAPKKIIGLIIGAFLTFASVVYVFDEVMRPIKGLLRGLRKMGSFLSNRKTKFLSSLGKRIGSFFEAMRQFGRNIKAWGLKKFRGGLKRFKAFFTKIGKFFTKITKAARFFNKFTKFLPLLRAGLSKVFLPITVLFAIFDFVKGFMKGYKEGGIIGGITEGIVAVFDGLVGGLLRLLGWIPKKLLELLGLDAMAARVMPTINAFLDGIINTFRGLIDIIVGIFTLDGSKIMGGLKKIWDSIVGIIMVPFLNMGAFVKDIFGVDPFENIKETFKMVIDAVVAVFDKLKDAYFKIIRKIPGGGWILDKLGVGSKKDGEDELKSKRASSHRRRGSNLIKKTPASMGKDYSMAKSGGNRGRGSVNANSQTNNSVSNNVSYTIQGNTDISGSALNFATGGRGRRRGR